MFEKEMDSLLRQHFSLLERIKKGEQMVASTDKSSEEYKRYSVQLRYLKGAAYRASACIDILNGDVILIGEQGGSLVIAKSDDYRAKQLAERAEEFGGFITRIDIYERAKDGTQL